MKKRGISAKTVVVIDVGAVVFVVLGRFVVIPTGFPDTNIETPYASLALVSAIFEPFTGLITGLIGHTIKDFTTCGSAWWSWIICSGTIGCLYGWIGLKSNLSSGRFSRKLMVYFNIGRIITSIICWTLIASTLDVLIYNGPASKVHTQGVISAVLSIISVGIIEITLLEAYASSRTRKGSLRKE